MSAAGGQPERPYRIQLLLDSDRLREHAFDRSAVITLWQKAVASASDAVLPGLSLDGALRAAYDAALLAAHAILASRHLRVSSSQGHHEVTFAAVAAYDIPELENLVPDSERVRALRRGSLYDPVLATEGDRERAIAWMRAVLPRMRAALVAWDATLSRDLAATR